MQRERRPLPPLDVAAIERMALRYVEKYATTRGKLRDYCARKIRERGWEGLPFDAAALADRFAELGYIDDRAFAEARARAMGRRGLGGRRVSQALHFAGVERPDLEAIAPEIADRKVETALEFARRKRIGPFAAVEADRVVREKQIGAMVRAGHDPQLARTIARMAPGESCEMLLDVDQ
jgi:regulatory protein